MALNRTLLAQPQFLQLNFSEAINVCSMSKKQPAIPAQRGVGEEPENVWVDEDGEEVLERELTWQPE